MATSSTIARFCTLLLLLSAALHLPAQSSRQRIALTFDDLPSTGEAPPGMTSLDIARSILRALHSAHAPLVYGFVNAATLTDSPEETAVLRAWTAAGNPLGNHTFSHLDLTSSTVKEYENDIAADEPVLRKFMDHNDWRWFRYPYLSEGETLEKRAAVRSFLKQQGYRIAEVTIDFGDYAWNDPYARCLAIHNPEAVRGLEESYLAHAEASLNEGREAARLAYGRDIPHVMLLHIGGIETAMLPRLLALLRRKGFMLATLQEVESDPVYNLPPVVALRIGRTLTQQALEARHLSAPPQRPAIFQQLDALCR